MELLFHSGISPSPFISKNVFLYNIGGGTVFSRQFASLAFIEPNTNPMHSTSVWWNLSLVSPFAPTNRSLAFCLDLPFQLPPKVMS